MIRFTQTVLSSKEQVCHKEMEFVAPGRSAAYRTDHAFCLIGISDTSTVDYRINTSSSLSFTYNRSIHVPVTDELLKIYNRDAYIS